MQQDYLGYLTKIVENQPRIQKTKKNILYILLTHWFSDKTGLTVSELQKYLNKASVVYKHIEDLKALGFVSVADEHIPLRITINIEAIEELGRQQREKDCLKSKVISLNED